MFVSYKIVALTTAYMYGANQVLMVRGSDDFSDEVWATTSLILKSFLSNLISEI